MFGFAARAVAEAIDESWTAGPVERAGGSRLGRGLGDRPRAPRQLGRARSRYIGLIAAVLGLTLVRGWVRIVLLVPMLYLAAFVWENVMLAKPEPTRYIVLGVILVVLMIRRPNGLLGERRVEIV